MIIDEKNLENNDCRNEHHKFHMKMFEIFFKGKVMLG